MKIELHILQNFAPSNLNRDDTGAPKDCELGGFRRARISSQCQKRAVREAFRLDKLIAEDNLAARTKRLIFVIADELVAAHKRPEAEARRVAAAAIEGAGLARNKKGSGEDAWKTQYLLYVPRRTAKAVAKVLNESWEKLLPLAAAADEAPEEASPAPEAAEAGKGKAKKDAKKDAKAAKKEARAEYPKEIREAVEGLLQSARASADLSLFGRMIADRPEWNVEAACQVAHALSTNKVQMDFDFFTAVDDFKPGDNAGSDMMGTVQFNSSCFYRYAVLDVAALKSNLDLPDEKESAALLRTTVHAFLEAFVRAIPTGKQNNTAAHNPPSYVLAIARDGGHPVSLANAFLKPARPRGEDTDLVDDSVQKLEGYLDRMRELLGGASLWTWADRDLGSREGLGRVAKLGQLYDQVTDRALKGAGS